MIKSNTNIIQRSIRILLGLILLYAGLFRFGGLDGETFGVILLIASMFPLAIGISGYCPLCNKKEKNASDLIND
jgi:uncharacterized membrane protein